MRVNVRITNWCCFKVTYTQRMPIHTHTDTHRASQESRPVQDPSGFPVAVPHNLEADLNTILVSTADTSQWNPEDLEEWVSKLRSKKDTKTPVGRSMETAKQIFSYFRHPSDRQNRSQSLPTRSRRTAKIVSTRSITFPFISTF